MVERCDQVFSDDLRMIGHLLDRAHGGAGHALAEELFPFECRAPGEGRTQFGDQLSGMRGPAGRASRIVRQRRPPDLPATVPNRRNVGDRG